MLPLNQPIHQHLQVGPLMLLHFILKVAFLPNLLVNYPGSLLLCGFISLLPRWHSTHHTPPFYDCLIFWVTANRYYPVPAVILEIFRLGQNGIVGNQRGGGRRATDFSLMSGRRRRAIKMSRVHWRPDGGCWPGEWQERVLTSQHYGKLWLLWLWPSLGFIAGDSDHRVVRETSGIFLDFSCGFLLETFFLWKKNKRRSSPNKAF